MRNKSEKEAPEPGSDRARAAGCECPAIDNHYGKGRGGFGKKYGWFISSECTIHWQEDDS